MADLAPWRIAFRLRRAGLILHRKTNGFRWVTAHYRHPASYDIGATIDAPWDQVGRHG